MDSPRWDARTCRNRCILSLCDHVASDTRTVLPNSFPRYPEFDRRIFKLHAFGSSAFDSAPGDLLLPKPDGGARTVQSQETCRRGHHGFQWRDHLYSHAVRALGMFRAEEAEACSSVHRAGSRRNLLAHSYAALFIALPSCVYRGELLVVHCRCGCTSV